MRRRIGALVVVLAGIAAIPAAASAQSEAGSDPLALRVGVTSDLITANPFGVSAGSDWTVTTAQYDMLLKFAPQDLRAAPSLATGCEASKDSMTWTCTLQEGLTWSDGEPLTSRDVAFSYRFVIDHKIPQYKSYFLPDTVFETPDDLTLVWKAPEPTFAPEMPPWVYIVPEHVWGRFGEDADLKTIRSFPNVPSVASGPFVLTEWQEGQYWVLERNDAFWGDAPAIDEVRFQLYSNQEAMVQGLKNGEVDIIDGLSPSLFRSLEGEPNIATHRVVSDWWLNLAFNFGGQGPKAEPLPALHDLTVRRAILAAINKEQISDKVYQGTADPGDTIIRPASTFWHLDIPAEEEVAYDPEAAKAMLEDAGYVDSDGDGIREDPETGEPLEMLVPASEDTTGAVEAGRFIVDQLREIGIEVELQPSSDALMNDFWTAGNFDAYIWYWSGDPDPNYQLFVFTSEQCAAWSDGCWKDPGFDALYVEQRTTMDQDERQTVVHDAQRRAYEQVPGVVLAYPGWLEAYRTDRFEGWTPSPGEDGYLIPSYNYDTYITVRPVSATLEQPSQGLPGWVWAAGAGVIAIIVAMIAFGRRRDDEREEA